MHAFDIQPQGNTLSVGSANYQNIALAGESKGRSLYPRQQLLENCTCFYINGEWRTRNSTKCSQAFCRSL